MIEAIQWFTLGVAALAVAIYLFAMTDAKEPDCHHVFERWTPPERSHVVDGKHIYSQHRTCRKCQIVYQRNVNE